MFVDVIKIQSAADMYEAVMAHKDEQDIIIKAAAVADYTPAEVSDEKVKKKDDDMAIRLTRTRDILKALGENRKKDSSCVDSPWKPRICWKIPERSLRKKILT